MVVQTIKECQGWYLISEGSVFLGCCTSSIDICLPLLWRICSPFVFRVKQSSLLELLVAASEDAWSIEKAAHIYQSIGRNIAEHFVRVEYCCEKYQFCVRYWLVLSWRNRRVASKTKEFLLSALSREWEICDKYLATTYLIILYVQIREQTGILNSSWK